MSQDLNGDGIINSNDEVITTTPKPLEKLRNVVDDFLHQAEHGNEHDVIVNPSNVLSSEEVIDVVIAGYAIRYADGQASRLKSGSFGGIVKVKPERTLIVRNGPYAETSFSFAVTRDGEKQVLHVPTGVTALIGGSGTGKTELGNKLAHLLGSNALHVRMLEPEVPCITDPYLFLKTIADFLLQDNEKVMVIDSIRFAIYNPGEKTAAGAGGMNMALFTHLTTLSVMAEQLGKSIIMVINPVTVNADVLKLYIEALNGSVNGVMRMVSRGRFDWIARTEQSDRNPRAYEIALTADAIKAEQSEAPRVIDANREVVSQYLNVANRALVGSK